MLIPYLPFAVTRAATIPTSILPIGGGTGGKCVRPTAASKPTTRGCATVKVVLVDGRMFISRRSGFQKYKDKYWRRAAERRRGCGLTSARPQPRVAAPPCAVSTMADTILMSLDWPENSDQRVIRLSTGTERSVLPARLQDFGRVFLFSFPLSHSSRGVSSTRGCSGEY